MRYTRASQIQQEEKPADGGGMGDSNYGVRSLGSDADWGTSSSSQSQGEDLIHEHEHEAADDDDDGNVEVGEEALVEGIIPINGMGREVEKSVDSLSTNLEESNQPITLPSTSSLMPPMPPSPPQIPEVQQMEAGLSLSHAYIFDGGRDNDSEPSSPASFASMPSYMSSLSRTSSIAGIPSDEGVAGVGTRGGLGGSSGLGMGMGMGMGMGGSEELVMPLLNVSQTSGSRWSVSPQGSRGIKVVLLGQEDRKADLVRELREIKEVIELGKGEYGIIDDGRVIITLSTGLTPEDVRSLGLYMT